MRRGARSGAIAALVVIVAGAFFTIGWFTSNRGADRGPQGRVHELMLKNGRGRGDMRVPGGQCFQMPSQPGFGNQGYNAPRGYFGYGRGMMVPQQQGRGMMVPQQGQSGAQQSSPPTQVFPQGQ